MQNDENKREVSPMRLALGDEPTDDEIKAYEDKMRQIAFKEKIEIRRLRDEQNRKMELHKQQVKAIEESEYKIFDDERAKQAD